MRKRHTKNKFHNKIKEETNISVLHGLYVHFVNDIFRKLQRQDDSESGCGFTPFKDVRLCMY